MLHTLAHALLHTLLHTGSVTPRLASHLGVMAMEREVREQVASSLRSLVRRLLTLMKCHMLLLLL